MEEQTATIAFLSRETAKIDTLMAKVHQAIEHLKEFRTALISATVTGKIDVRGQAACSPEVSEQAFEEVRDFNASMGRRWG